MRVEQRNFVGVGLVCLDLISVRGEPSPVAARAGGTCGNVAALLAYLGWQAKPIARIGDDRAAVDLMSDLRKVGVDTSALAATAATPVIVHEVVRRGKTTSHRYKFNCQSCGAWYPRFRPLTLNDAAQQVDQLTGLDVLFIDRASTSAAIMAEVARSHGALIMFEPSGNGDPKPTRRLLDACHVLKFAADRASILNGHELPSDALVVETRGAQGLRYRVPNGRWRSRPAPCATHVVDPAGAGDWATATLLNGLVPAAGARVDLTDAAEIDKLVLKAQKWAAASCGFIGARTMSELRTPAENVDAIDGRSTAEVVELPNASSVQLGDLCSRCAVTTRTTGDRALVLS